MSAIKPTKRKVTSRELAEKFGTSPRHIRRIIAEPRDDFEARSKARQLEALQLREKGLSYRQIGSEMGISRDSAAGLVRRGRERVAA